MEFFVQSDSISGPKKKLQFVSWLTSTQINIYLQLIQWHPSFLTDTEHFFPPYFHNNLPLTLDPTIASAQLMDELKSLIKEIVLGTIFNHWNCISLSYFIKNVNWEAVKRTVLAVEKCVKKHINCVRWFRIVCNS